MQQHVTVKLSVTSSASVDKKYGIHKDLIFVHASTLTEAELKLKIVTKISDTSYNNCVKFSIHRIGQRYINLTKIWWFVSRVIFQCHSQRLHRILFASPEVDMIVWFHIVVFLENTSCIVSGDKNNLIEDLKKKKDRDKKLWPNLLWILGL